MPERATERCAGTSRRLQRTVPGRRALDACKHAWALFADVAVRLPGLTAVGVQAAAIMDNVARAVLPLLLRGTGLRADALSGMLDDIHPPSAIPPSCQLHVGRYRSPSCGEDGTGWYRKEALSPGTVRVRHNQKRLYPTHEAMQPRRSKYVSQTGQTQACALQRAWSCCKQQVPDRAVVWRASCSSSSTVLGAHAFQLRKSQASIAYQVVCMALRLLKDVCCSGTLFACGAEPHVDQSVLTVIAADTVNGVQVRTRYEG